MLYPASMIGSSQKNYSFGQSQNRCVVISLYIEAVYKVYKSRTLGKRYGIKWGAIGNMLVNKHVGNLGNMLGTWLEHIGNTKTSTPPPSPPKRKKPGLSGCMLPHFIGRYSFIYEIFCWPELVAIFGLSKWQGHEIWVSTVSLLVSNASKRAVLTLGPSLAKGWPFLRPWVFLCAQSYVVFQSVRLSTTRKGERASGS